MKCYIHIPFCNKKCKYCRFISTGVLQEEKIKKYVDNLIYEIKNSSFQNRKGYFLETIYFGGGTPSILSFEQLKLILDTLKSKFGYIKDIEITLESTPNNVIWKNMIGWSKLGINRLSIGVQTLNEKSLQEIGRGEKGDILEALDLFKNFNISLDFIVGLPFVKHGEIKKDIEYILDNYDFIKHISVYMLEEYYNSGKIKSGDLKVSKNIFYPNNWKELGINEEEYLGEYIEVKEFLESRGFYRYEISNFAKSGFECKHNMGYWDHSEIFAFGLGASGLQISSVSQLQTSLLAPLLVGEGNSTGHIRYTNNDNFEGYYAGKKLLVEELNEEDVFLERLMFGLRTNGIGKEIYKKLDKDKLDYFIENGYLELISNYSYPLKEEATNQILVLRDKGVLILDYILRELI